MNYIYLNILLIVLIIILIYINKNNIEKFNDDSYEETTDINQRIMSNLRKENPSITEVGSDLKQLMYFEEQCSDYYKQQQNRINQDILLLQKQQKNVLKQQKNEIKEYKRLLAYLKEIFNKDSTAVDECVSNNQHNINLDNSAVNDIIDNNLLNDNILEITLKK